MELEAIAENLRRQRRDLDALIDDTASRSIQTAQLLARIEDLRRRVEATRDRREVWGRPVGVLVLPDGSLLVSDDSGGKIWRVTYR